MSDEDKTLYLANVLLVALADENLSPREAAALDEIRKGVDAKKGQLASAKKAIEGGTHSFARVGSFSDQVRNLEDILFVALTDSDLEERELRLIHQYCELVGIHEDQLTVITDETTRRCDATLHSVTCPACSTVASAQSRFCPSCGKPFTNSDPVSMPERFELPREGYAIEFCESTSGGFSKALELARTTDTLQTAIKNKKTWYLVSLPATRFGELVPLASSLSGMRNRRIYVDGKEVTWDEVFGFVWCASRRTTAYRPVEYCFGKDENRLNPWGCKQAQMEWTEWARWFSYGRWQKTGMFRTSHVFVFDKERIRHELATALYRYRFCPHIRTQLAEAVLRHLPDQVEVTATGDWKYSRAFEALPGSIKVVEREGSGDLVFSSEYYSDGVRPRGFTFFAELLRNALKDCGYQDIAVPTLLSK
ncbi:MAG: zinc ribbon domain-containing protein [Nitrospirota bacterium]|nr:zinc ribbon domain-containing protein [Nitrospirota bacterium]